MAQRIENTNIFVLEKLCDSEKEGGRLCAAKRFSDIEQVDDFGEEDAAFSRAYRGFLQYHRHSESNGG
jgi:hypothetical protein